MCAYGEVVVEVGLHFWIILCKEYLLLSQNVRKSQSAGFCVGDVLEIFKNLGVAGHLKQRQEAVGRADEPLQRPVI